MGSKRKITINVEADTLFNFNDPKESDILACISMYDDEDSQINPVTGPSIKTFESNVFKDKDVRWEGKAVESGQLLIANPSEEWDYDVGIDFIIFMSQPNECNLFKKVVLTGRGGKHSKVTAKVKQKDWEDGDIYTYLVIFSIHKRGNGIKTFSFDPKLRGNY